MISYAQMKQDFERTHFKVIIPSGFVLHDENGFQRKSRKELFHMYKDKYYSERDSKGIEKTLPFLKRWVKDEDMRTYKRCQYYPPYVCPWDSLPQTCPHDVYNLYRG